MTEGVEVCLRCGQPEYPDESHEFGCPNIASINTNGVPAGFTADLRVLQRLVEEYMDQNLERVLNRVLDERMRKKNTEEFKRHMVPPPHWRD